MPRTLQPSSRFIRCSQNNTSSRGGDDLGDGGHSILADIILGEIEFIVMALI